MEAQVIHKVEAILEARVVIVVQEVAREAARKIVHEVVQKVLPEAGQCLATEVEASLVVGAPAEAEVSPFRGLLVVRLVTPNGLNQIDVFYSLGYIGASNATIILSIVLHKLAVDFLLCIQHIFLPCVIR